jgi:hypothetical protein
MPPVGFEHTIPASARSQTHALDRAATGIGWISAFVFDKIYKYYLMKFYISDLRRNWTVVGVSVERFEMW